MKVGITGGSGFLGRKLALYLVARGDAVVAFSRRPGGAPSVLPPPVVWKEWDPSSGPISSAWLDELDVVISLAGEPAKGLWTAGKKKRMWDSRILGTRHLVHGWRGCRTPPKVFLSCSAAGYYGDGGDTELTESSPSGQGFLAELSREWERESFAAETLGARVVQLRVTLPLHPDGGILGAILPAFRLGLGATLGTGEQWFPWIHIEDWLALMVFILDNDSVRGPLNLTAPSPVRNKTFTKALASAVGRPAIFRAPAGVLRLLVREAADEMVLASQRVVPEKALAMGFSFRFPELKPALEDLL